MTRRFTRWLLIVTAVVLLAPVVVSVAAIVFANTPAGARLVERQTAKLSSGRVQLFGVRAALPSGLRIGRIEIRDNEGIWLSIDDAALDLRPWHLLSQVLDASSLSARHMSMLRLPKSSGGSSSGGGFELPLRLEMRHVRAERIDIAAPVTGTPLALSVEGHAAAQTVDAFRIGAAVRDIDTAGAYDASLSLAQGALKARVEAKEPPRGAISNAAGLPDVGALTLLATADGPLARLATHLTLSAGPLRLAADGTVDLGRSTLDLDVTGQGPAMTLAPDVSWTSLGLNAHVAGAFAAPDARGHLMVEGLSGRGAKLRRLTADVSADRGKVAIQAVAEGVRVPGPQPARLEADPVHASFEVTLREPEKPLLFALSHPLLELQGHGHLAPTLALSAQVNAADLGPYGTLAGVDLRGSTVLSVTMAKSTATEVTVDGTLRVTSGPGPSAALVGDAAQLGITAQYGPELTVSRLTFEGAGLRLKATGHFGDRLGADAVIDLPDLKAVAPHLGGRLRLQAKVDGTAQDLALQAELQGTVATAGLPSGNVMATVRATGLPSAPAGRVTAEGQLDGAPLWLDAAVSRGADGTTRVSIDRADWRSAHADGALSLSAGATLPIGRVALRMTRLDDLRRLAGMALSGRIEATVESAERLLTAHVRAEQAGIPGGSVTRATLDARLADPLGEGRVDATLAANGVQAAGTRSDANIAVAGPRTALAIRADATSLAMAGGPASISTRAVLNFDRKTVDISALQAVAKGQTVRLLAPAKVSFGDTVAVDRLRLGLRDAVLEVAGRASPTLDLTASLRNVRADLASLVEPNLAADGVVSADARLTGTPARPSGNVRLDATGLHLRHGPASTLPPIAVSARADLAGSQARLDATVSGGRNRLTVTGTAPIDPAASFDLRTAGGIDLAMLDPLLAAGGRRVRGQLAVDAGLAGTLAAPRASGTLRLTGGEVQDFAQGVRLDRIEALLTAAGDSLRLDRLDARAGGGTISATGSVGISGQRPVDLRIVARNATPLTSDLLTARLDADLSVRGFLQQRLDLGGSITVRRADIRVPERLPVSIPVLNVVQPTAKPAPVAAPLAIGLALSVTSSGQIFVRGRGIDAELAGDLRVGGTTAQPLPDGGFTLRRGTLSVAGKTLTFSSGSVTFNGGSRIDPSLHFVASSGSSSVIATLTVGGTASDPKIILSSVPPLPQDEVLARLLFGQSAASLGPLELAEIAAALAQLSGASGGGFDPLNAVRKGLGLDRLSVGGGGSGTSPNVEAGRYVAPGVYVGARQATSGGGTQALVQIDLLRGLKLESTAGTGGGSAQGSAQSGAASNGTGVGVTYQFEY